MDEHIELETSERTADPSLGELLFIGTATVLLDFGGFTVLTDPNFLHQGEHAPLGGGLRSRRLTEPAVQIDQLPPIDLVVLSHHHGDHFDQRAADGLDPGTRIVSTAHAVRKLARQGFRRLHGVPVPLGRLPPGGRARRAHHGGPLPGPRRRAAVPGR